MASVAPLKDIDEKFLQCAICLCQLKEPTLLPCLHRYCRECLKKIVKEGDQKVQCPTCREKHVLPQKGVDGFKGDFNTQNIIEFIQLNESVKNESLKVCINCNKKLKVASYCFRCSDFLCQKCDKHHRTSRIVQDHQPHMFSLEGAGARSLTIEKLSSLNEAPRCREHPEKVSELCCTTCDNLPICIACVYGAHQGHILKEVKSLAKVEREKLTQMLDGLMQHKEQIYRQLEETKFTKENLPSSVDEKKLLLQQRLDVGKQEMEAEIVNVNEDYETQRIRVEEDLKRKAQSRKKRLEKAMRELKVQYEEECEKEKWQAEAELKELHKECERKKTTLRRNLDAMNADIHRQLIQITNQEEADAGRVHKLLEHSDNVVKKFEIVTATASSILSGKNDWTDIQCIPDIRAAIDPLMTDIGENSGPERGTPPAVMFGDVPYIAPEDCMTGQEESVRSIVGIGQGWYITDIASNNSRCSVITGYAPSHRKTFIAVINSKGECLRLGMFRTFRASQVKRFCDFISQYEIVTATSISSEIGIYDIRDGKYGRDNFKNIIRSHPQERKVSCLAFDHVQDRILVGEWQSRGLIVLDTGLKYLQYLELPGSIACPTDILVRDDGDLLVCDWRKMKVLTVTKMQSRPKLSGELSKPEVDGEKWKPSGVCRDTTGLIYILWVSSGAVDDVCIQASRRKERSVLAQYSRDGGQLKALRSLGQKCFARKITTVNTSHGEKVLLPTYETGQLITYGLYR